MINKIAGMFLTILAFQSIPTSALAEGLELGAGALTINTEGVSTTSGGLNLGYRVSDNLALEFGAYTGGSEGDTDGNISAVIEIDSVITARLKYGMALGDNALGYISAGYTDVSLSINACARSTCFADSDGLSGGTLGLGVDFKFNENWGGTVEYVRAFGDIEDTNVGVFSIKYFFN